jgi:RNA polymerase sigma-70 factor (ECF subfamily)
MDSVSSSQYSVVNPLFPAILWELEELSGQEVGVDLLDEQAMRASLRDAAAFGPVFERHHLVIWRYLARSAGRQVADELAGEVFLIAFRRRASFDAEKGSVRAWLYGIAANQLREQSRRAARRRRAVLRLAGRREATHPAPAADEASVLVGQAETDSVVQCLNGLGESDREILLLFAWERLTYEEIAAALAVPVGTVRSRLARARGRLRQAMELAGPSDELPVEASDAPGPRGRN